MNKQKANGDQGLSGLAGGLRRKGGGPHAQDRSLQGYYDHDYESFLAVLKKNGKKLAIDPSRRETAEALRERIRQSDELIDAVVVHAVRAERGRNQDC